MTEGILSLGCRRRPFLATSLSQLPADHNCVSLPHITTTTAMSEQAPDASDSASQNALDLLSLDHFDILKPIDKSAILQDGYPTELGFTGLSLALASAMSEKRSMVTHKPMFFNRSPPKVIADNASTRFTVSNASCSYTPERGTCDFEQAIDLYCPGVRETIATGGAPSVLAADPTLDEKIELCTRLLLKGHEQQYHSQPASQQQTENYSGGKPEGSASHGVCGQ